MAFSKKLSRIPRPGTEPFMAMSMAVLAFNITTVPQLLIDKICHNNYNESICKDLSSYSAIQNHVQHIASSWMSIAPLIAMLPGVFMMFLLGPFADVYGKKNTIALLPLVYFIQSITFLILASIKEKFSPGTFIIASCLSGMFGDNAGLELLCVAYIADTTAAEKRTFRVAVLEGSMFIGSLTASLLGGIMLQRYGFRIIFIITGFINVANFVYAWCCLPDESEIGKFPEDSMFRKFDNSSQLINTNGDIQAQMPASVIEACNPYRCFLRVRDAVCISGIKGIVANLLALLAFAQIANMGELYVGVLFLKHSPFNFKPHEIGYFVAAQSSIRAFGMTAVAYICQRVLKITDLSLVVLGFSSQAIYLLVYGASISKLMLYLTQLIGLAASLHLPVLRSMMSKIVPDDQHGSALAAIEAVDVSSSIVASLISNTIYSMTVGVFPGFSLFILAIFSFVGLGYAVIMIIIRAKGSRLKNAKPVPCSSNDG